MNFKPLDNDHPVARLLDREAEVIALAKELMAKHNLHDWTFKIADTKTALGTCSYYDKTIEYSRYYLNAPMEQIRDTILHEIAHAIAGYGAGHNWEWKHVARSIGARPTRCAPPEIESEAAPNYLLTCPTCGRSWTRYRLRRRSMIGARCPDCHTEITITDLRG